MSEEAIAEKASHMHSGYMEGMRIESSFLLEGPIIGNTDWQLKFT